MVLFAECNDLLTFIDQQILMFLDRQDGFTEHAG